MLFRRFQLFLVISEFNVNSKKFSLLLVFWLSQDLCDLWLYLQHKLLVIVYKLCQSFRSILDLVGLNLAGEIKLERRQMSWQLRSNCIFIAWETDSKILLLVNYKYL